MSLVTIRQFLLRNINPCFSVSVVTSFVITQHNRHWFLFQYQKFAASLRLKSKTHSNKNSILGGRKSNRSNNSKQQTRAVMRKAVSYSLAFFLAYLFPPIIISILEKVDKWPCTCHCRLSPHEAWTSASHLDISIDIDIVRYGVRVQLLDKLNASVRFLSRSILSYANF